MAVATTLLVLSPCLLARDAAPCFLQQLCNNCFKPGHLAADCPNETACNNCRQVGHRARECDNSPVCNSCGQSGHMARACPGAAVTAGPQCHTCGLFGHLARNCPTVRALQVRCALHTSHNHRFADSHRTTVLAFRHSAVDAPWMLLCLSLPAWVLCPASKEWTVNASCPGFPRASCFLCRVQSVVTVPHPMSMGAYYGGAGMDASVTCLNCRLPGHFARDCPSPVLCNTCGGRGHIAAECPSDARALRGRR